MFQNILIADRGENGCEAAVFDEVTSRGARAARTGDLAAGAHHV